jgi:DNA polymerase/3'-5' exonuclease PolX
MSSANPSDYKQLIVDALEVMRKREVAEKQTFKANAYRKVINQLNTYNGTITSYEDVKGIDGIGEKISDKIKEILETGQLKAAESVKEKYDLDSLDAFQKIYGVGPTKAMELVNAGYKTIADLRAALKKDKKLLNDKQQIGLKHYEVLLERIPRLEMQEHEDILNQLIPDESNFEIELVGSYRREAETSGDIDVLIRVPKGQSEKQSIELFFDYVKLLEGFGYITEILALGAKKCMAICNIYNGKPRRLDLLMTPDNEYACALLYFTGSDRFNVAFRNAAQEKGYKLNEHSLTKIRQDVPEVPYMKTERDIFKFLNLDYIRPSQRIDANQIRAPKRKPPVGKLNN